MACRLREHAATNSCFLSILYDSWQAFQRLATSYSRRLAGVQGEADNRIQAIVSGCA